MSRHAWIFVTLCACGGPALQNVPKPSPAVVAGAAAATAAAITLASPADAAKLQEARNKGEPDDRGVVVKETVPGDVFDRLDQGTRDAGVDAAPPAAVAPAAPPSPR